MKASRPKLSQEVVDNHPQAWYDFFMDTNTNTNTNRCEICGEPEGPEMGEFYDPAHPEVDSLVAHAHCGLARGLDIA